MSTLDPSGGLTPLFGRDTSGGLTPGVRTGRGCVSTSRSQRPRLFRQGEWSDDGNKLEGEWECPGGGYKETMTRVA
jgi:hypothetical protein